MAVACLKAQSFFGRGGTIAKTRCSAICTGGKSQNPSLIAASAGTPDNGIQQVLKAQATRRQPVLRIFTTFSQC